LLQISLRRRLQRHSLSYEETSFSHFDRFVFGFNVVLLGAQARTPSSSGKTLKGKAVHTVVGGK
jgi:hypothetical protein